MKVKARKLKQRRAHNSKNPWYNIRPMDATEANSAKNAVLGLLKRHADGLHYGKLSPEEAILQKVQRGQYGDRHRQLLVFKAVMNELKKLGAISYDPVRQRISYNSGTLVK